MSALLFTAVTLLVFSSCSSRKGGASKKAATEVAAGPVVGADEQAVMVPEETGDPAPAAIADEAGEESSLAGAEQGESGEPTGESGPETGTGEPGKSGDDAGAAAESEEIPYEEVVPEEISFEEEIPFDEPPLAEEPAVSGSTEPGEELPADSTGAVLPLLPVTDAGGVIPADTTAATLPGGEEEEFYPELDENEPTAGTYEPDAASPEGGNMKVVDFEADIMRPINITDDSTALNLLGNVVFYHNGAVITCDSAVRYSEKRMDCFKRVIINNGTTYVYGDRAEYNGEMNLARVFAPIVKMVDEDAVLYTYRFSFNTLTNIGVYGGGGVLTQNDNHLESLRGFYDTDTRVFTGAGEVELTNPEYKLISDSVRYNLDTEVAEFFTTTHIWNEKGDILIADRGSYRNATSDYDFTSNSYILTESQEIWADTLRHNSLRDYTELRRDIQIIDEENNSMAFGDYGEYWGETEHGLLTIDPALVSYDPENPADTLYMRSDSMFFYTYDYDIDFFEDTTAPVSGDEFPAEELIETPVTESPIAEVPIGEEGELISVDEEGVGDAAGSESPPGEGAVGQDREGEADRDALSVDSGGSKKTKTSRRERKAAAAESPALRTDDGNSITESRAGENSPTDGTEVRGEASSVDKVLSDDGGYIVEIEGEGDAVGENGENGAVVQETDSETEETFRIEQYIDGESEVAASNGETTDREEEQLVAAPRPELYVSPYAEVARLLKDAITTDSTDAELSATEFWLTVRERIEEDSLLWERYTAALGDVLAENAPAIDTLAVDLPLGDVDAVLGTLFAESAAERESARAVAEAQPQDSVQRVFYGYKDVRIFRNDLQAVCDSLVGFSKDSTLHMHINPVMWSDENQVVADVIVIFTRDEQLYKAEYTGSPFMSSQVDSTRFNQIKGKFMVSWFRDNDLYRHDVFGNGQTHYYMQDDNTGDIDGFMTVECADITFFIEESQIDEIIFRYDPVYWLYPIDMIPPDVDEFLPGFSWEADRRPMSKEDVFTRTIRPRQRERVLGIPQPEFPITAEMDRNRKRLTEQKLWRDRNDRLSPQALEFMHYVDLRDADKELNGE